MNPVMFENTVCIYQIIFQIQEDHLPTMVLRSTGVIMPDVVDWREISSPSLYTKRITVSQIFFVTQETTITTNQVLSTFSLYKCRVICRQSF